MMVGDGFCRGWAGGAKGKFQSNLAVDRGCGDGFESSFAERSLGGEVNGLDVGDEFDVT